MSRLLFPFVALLCVPALANAQVGGGTPQPPTFVPISPAMPGISPVPRPVVPGRPGRPIIPLPPIWGGGWFPYYGYGYPAQQPPVVVQVQAPPVVVGTPAEPDRVVVISNEFPATLVLEFPSAAEVWVNGKKAEDEATNEWVLTSPVLKQGEEYKFEVRGRWKSNGKTYEAERSIAVPGGKRSRSIVVAGAEVRE
jgi:uncharacterized protein (TIGR03000 family)